MIDLVRFQNQPVEVEEDEICFTTQQMIAFENKSRKPYGKYFDGIQCGVSSQIIKRCGCNTMLDFNNTSQECLAALKWHAKLE